MGASKSKLRAVAKKWEAANHPRYPAGHPQGGKFMPKDGAATWKPPVPVKRIAGGFQGDIFITEGNTAWKTFRGAHKDRQLEDERRCLEKLNGSGVAPDLIGADKRGVEMTLLTSHRTFDDLSKPEQKQVADSVARTIARMHQLGVAHGDLHQKNVMTAGQDVKLIDFGSGSILPSPDKFFNYLSDDLFSMEDEFDGVMANHSITQAYRAAYDEWSENKKDAAEIKKRLDREIKKILNG